MNKLLKKAALIVVAGLVFGLSLVKLNEARTQVTVYVGDHFDVPAHCKNLALLGCTPHPTHYLKDHGNDPASLKNLRLDDFLDKAYVQDSFVRTFNVCKDAGVDHLIIAYLPIYFIRLQPLLCDQFVVYCRMFLTNIVPDMIKLIEDAVRKTGYLGQATLIIPTDNQLAQVPHGLADKDERIRYLIKQFPTLRNINQSSLSTITIINNEQSSEDDRLIAYLKYEYLFEKPITYRTCSTGKKQFHKGKS